MTGKHEAGRRARQRSEEVQAEHMLYNIVFAGAAFFACWGVASFAVVVTEQVCRWLGI